MYFKSSNQMLSLAVGSLMGLTVLSSGSAYAFPVNPSKVPVSDVKLGDLEHQFTLAYDSSDKKIVYYSPKGGRVAVMNGMPLIGFTKIGSKGFLNVQLEYGVFGHEKDDLFRAIEAAGYTARPFPYIQTTVVPIIPGFDAEGKKVCQEVLDLSTNVTKSECEESMYEQLRYSKNGPSLGENIALSAVLTEFWKRREREGPKRAVKWGPVAELDGPVI
jgi:hypothetical protein